MKVEWDPQKAVLNLRRHCVSFEEAESALTDPLALTANDRDHSSHELRFITFAVSKRQRLLVIAFTKRGDAIRIISARLASKRERKIYEED
jgi:uncharacterized DUF497 family protein